MLAAVTRTDFADIDVPLWAWGALVGAIVVMLVVDLLIVHRRPHAVGFREAAIESGVWIALGVAFTAVIWGWGGYLIEKSLSVDNVFVWAVLFSYFAVPREYQFRVLFWGIFGALALRAAFIFAGVALLEQFEWVLYVFGVFLVFTAVRIARHQETAVRPERNLVLRLMRKIVPSTNAYDGQNCSRIGRADGSPHRCSPCSSSWRRPTCFRRRLRPRHPGRESGTIYRVRFQRFCHPRTPGDNYSGDGRA